MLVACGPRPEAPPPPRPPAPEDADAVVWAGLSSAQAQVLRAAMMRAQVEVAQRLVAEGAGGAAATHILRVTSELYLPAKANYERLGVAIKEADFLRAAEAASGGVGAGEMRSHTDNLLRQIARLKPRADAGSPTAVKMLLRELAHQYGQAVQGGFVINDTRYQDAFGLAIVARDVIRAAADDGAAKGSTGAVKREAEGIVNMFTSASQPTAPADAGEMLAQINRVERALLGEE